MMPSSRDHTPTRAHAGATSIPRFVLNPTFTTISAPTDASTSNVSPLGRRILGVM